MFRRQISISADGLTLAGEVGVPDDPPLLAVLCHGIPGAGSPDPPELGYAGFARMLNERGFATLWFNFRGVRGAPGEFSIAGWARDLEAALDALECDAEIGGIPRVAVGSSAGGVVAISVAARREDILAVATLAAPASFTFGGLIDDPRRMLATFRNIGIVHDPNFPDDVDAWWREFLEAAPEEVVAKIAPRPILIVHGEADDVVPYIHAERLFASAGEPKELARIPGGGHQLRKESLAIDALADWLAHLER